MILEALAAAFWLVLAALQLRAGWELRSLPALLLAAESLLVGFRLLRRRRAAALAPRWLRWAAWLSLFLPLALRGVGQSAFGQALAVLGLALTLWGLWRLGPAFGVAPADRGLVIGGPYRLVRHPMYAGALLNALGFVWANLNAWNLFIFAALLACAVLRIRREEAVLGGYAAYARRVRWRLLPGVW